MNTNESALTSEAGLFRSELRLRLDIAYDGTDYLGWATQPQGPTIQSAIEEALTTIIGQPVSLVVAGRTDTGVHARGQVAHVDLPIALWERHNDRMLQRLNGLLGDAIRINSIAPAAPGFDARFSALARHYIYRISISSAGPDPLARRDRIHRSRPLDVQAMRQAAAALLGEHNFLAFCKPRPGATTVRTLLTCDVVEVQDGIELQFSADAFCHSMVRAIAGALLAVGEGRKSVAWVRELLDVNAKPSDVTVLPARGLTLERVDYPADTDLGERARLTRARRSSE